MSNEPNEDGAQVTNVPVRLHAYEQAAQFVNHISVNGAGDLVQLEFSQVVRPAVESEDQLQELIAQGLSGYLISRLLVPEDVFRNFIVAMAEQVAASEEEL